MKLLMTRGARGEAGDVYSAGDVVEVSDELGYILINSGRATTNLPKPAPKQKKAKAKAKVKAATDGS